MAEKRWANCPRCDGETVRCQGGLNGWLRWLGGLMSVVSVMVIVTFSVPAIDPFGIGEGSRERVLTNIKQGQSQLTTAFQGAGFSSELEGRLKKGPALSMGEMEALSQSQRDFLVGFEKEVADARSSWLASAGHSGWLARKTLLIS